MRTTESIVSMEMSRGRLVDGGCMRLEFDAIVEFRVECS